MVVPHAKVEKGLPELDGILNIKVPTSEADPAWKLAPHDDAEAQQKIQEHMARVNGFKGIKAANIVLPTDQDFVDLCNKSYV